jgi:hypothetical protein
MQEIYLDTLKLHDREAGTSHKIEANIRGLEFPSSRLSSYNRAGQDGIRITNHFAGERRITIEGVIRSDTCEEQQDFRQEIEQAVIMTRVNNVPVPKELKFINQLGTEFVINVEVVNFIMPLRNQFSDRFLIDMIAYDPYIRSTTLNSENLVTATFTGFIIPFDIPFWLGSGTLGDITITNGGAATYPTITLNGPLTNPSVKNLTTGEFMKLNYTLTAGNQVVMDFENNTIVLNGTTNLIGMKSAGSTWWQLANGNNTIRLITSISGEAGTGVIEWYEVYVGL